MMLQMATRILNDVERICQGKPIQRCSRPWRARGDGSRKSPLVECARRLRLRGAKRCRRATSLAIMRLAFLSPSIVETVVEGRTPVELNLQMLMTMRPALSLAWRDQEELFRNLGWARPADWRWCW